MNPPPGPRKNRGDDFLLSSTIGANHARFIFADLLVVGTNHVLQVVFDRRYIPIPTSIATDAPLGPRAVGPNSLQRTVERLGCTGVKTQAPIRGRPRFIS